jgi:hypothetical protein
LLGVDGLEQRSRCVGRVPPGALALRRLVDILSRERL